MAMQTCPLVTKAASTMRSARAASPTTSGARMAASFPPSSSTTGRVVAAAVAMTAWPVPTPPVKETMSTSGWPTNAAPSAASGPFTTLRTPGGSISAMAAATRSTVPGQDGGALTTTVSPASNAGSTLLPMTDTGQLKGSTAATTPCGTHSMRVAPPARSRGASASATSGAKADAMPPMVAVSKIASRCVLPCSRVSSRARSCAFDGGHARLGRRHDPSGAVFHFERGPGSLRSAGGGHRQVELCRRRGRGVEHDLGRAGRVGHRVGARATGVRRSPSISRPIPVMTSSTCVVMRTPRA